MKRLFTDEDRYNEAANEMISEIAPQIRKVVEKWVRKGYSARDVQLVIQMEVMDASLLEIMTPSNYLERKKKDE